MNPRITRHSTLNDEKLVELYRKFQSARRSLGQFLAGMAYDDFVDRGSYGGIAMSAAITASEHILSITNTVNIFCYDIHTIAAWAKVFEAACEEDAFQALVEFVVPAASHCLSAPYAIKQMFIKSICKVSHQTNRFYLSGWNEAMLKPDKKLDFNEAVKLAGHFTSWPRMYSALADLNNSEFTEACDDYRSRFNHGFPPRIELGNTLTVDRDPQAFFYLISDRPPLRISALVPPLCQQYEAALDCASAYVGLLREQENRWPRPGHVAEGNPTGEQPGHPVADTET